MRTLFILFAVIISMTLKAQKLNFDDLTSEMRIARVLYAKDDRGFWQKKENVNVEYVYNILSVYAYNKKTKELFVKTENSNCIILLKDNVAKHYKKYSSVPQLKGKDLEIAINNVDKELESYFYLMNQKRQKEIDDSIRIAKEDSIKREREESIRVEKEKLFVANYKKNHKWFWVPTNNVSLYCDLCQKNVRTNDSTFCMAIKNDSIYWATTNTGYLDEIILEMHAAKMTKVLIENASFASHYKIYADSLQYSKPDYSASKASIGNLFAYENYLDNVKKLAPHGFFVDWGWDNEYSMITFNFKYMNTNKKTIKYITVYWTVKNDVGDVRKTGYFKGTGPLKEWESASWDWDSSSYFVAGDASIMNITKVVLNYMDGTSVTLSKNKIVFN